MMEENLEAVEKALKGVDASKLTEEQLSEMISTAMDNPELVQVDEQNVPLSDKTLESYGRSW